MSQINLENTLDTILSLTSINSKNLFTLIFIAEQNIFSGIDNKIINDNINKISACFDLNGDGKLDMQDLEYLRKLDLISITKIINGTRYFLEIVELLSEVNYNSQQKVNLTYKTIVYALLLTLTQNLDGFRNWINTNSNKELLIEILELINTTLISSVRVNNLINKINFNKIFCCFNRENITNKVLNLQTKINTETADIHNTYRVNKKLELIESHILKLTETKEIII